MHRPIAILAAAAMAAALTACGGGSSDPAPAGTGASAADAPIAPEVAAAAEAAGCTVRGSPPYGVVLGSGAPQAPAVDPPVVGEHVPTWADWGVYDTAVPPLYLVHNMAHGGIVIWLGAGVSAPARDEV